MSTTASWSLTETDKGPQEYVEGTLVLWRTPSSNQQPRYSAPFSDLEATVRAGCNRLAILHTGSSGQSYVWATSTIRAISSIKGGFTVVTEHSKYHVEILAGGQTPRRARRDTGSFPIYDPTPVPDAV